MTFAQTLKRLRLERGLSQEELAHRLGTSRQVVSRYESGARVPKISTVAAFARALEVPLSALTGELSGDEMSHLTTLLQKPESTANASQALADYIRVIREEQTKRDDSGVDPLLLAMETFKDKKRYGGKRT